jgi:predicted RNA-binding Zn ribbon-like protein
MASGHSVDELGRMLPDPAWPADKAAPHRWDVIRRFCNTSNRESGADRFDTEVGLARWTASEGIYGETANRHDVIRLVSFREHVRAHALAHLDRIGDAAIDASLADYVAGLPFTLAGRAGRFELVPDAVGVVDQTIGTVAIAIMDAQRSDCWRRFKACRGCEWVFYDRSKNQSGRWCSMSACGGRAKVAAFRQREKDSSG